MAKGFNIGAWFGRAQTKASETFRGITAIMTPNQPVWTEDNYEKMAQEGYESNVYAYSCIRLIGMAAAGIPLRVYTKGAKRKELEAHPLKKLLDRPNPYTAGQKFTEAMVSSLLISGNAFVERVGPDSKPPLELYVLRTDRMQVLVGDSVDYVAGYRYTVGGQKVDFPREQILHLRLFHPTHDWYGLAPLKSAFRAIDVNNQAHAFDLSMLQNMAIPGGALKYDGSLTQQQKEDIKAGMRAGYGTDKAFSPMVLEAGMSWENVGLSPVDMCWEAAMTMSAREIAIAFNVAPELIGDSANKTYSNVKEARQALYMETVLPLLDWYVGELNNWLAPLYGQGVEVGYDKDDIEAIQPDRTDEWNRIMGGVSAGVLTINEARELLGFDPIMEGDRILVSSAMQPLTDEFVNPPEPQEVPDQLKPFAGNPPDDNTEATEEPDLTQNGDKPQADENKPPEK